MAPPTTRPRRAATQPLRSARPRRGTADLTRERLVAAAAIEFNRVGYHGTDSNRLARAAGYAPATFYKHFPDKRAIFLAAYAGWVTAEWSDVERLVREGGGAAAIAARIVGAVLAMHRRWRGLRASLRGLVAADEAARAFYREQRRQQLQRLAALRPAGAPAHVTDDALLLFTLERVCDAIADGELRDLGVPVGAAVEHLRALLTQHISRGGFRPARPR